MPNINGTEGVFLAARVDQGGCDTDRALGIFLWIYPGKLLLLFLILRNSFILINFQTINTKTFFISGNQTFLLTTDMTKKSVMKQRQVGLSLNEWFTVAFSIQKNKVSTLSVHLCIQHMS